MEPKGPKRPSKAPPETKKKHGGKKTPKKTLKKTCLSKGTGSAFKGRALQRHVLKFCIRCSKQREQSKKGGPIESSGLRPRLAAWPRPRLRRWKQRSQKRLSAQQNTSYFFRDHSQQPQTSILQLSHNTNKHMLKMLPKCSPKALKTDPFRDPGPTWHPKPSRVA